MTLPMLTRARFTRTVAVSLTLSLALGTLGLVAAPRPAFAQPKRPKSVRDLLPESAKTQWDSGISLATRSQWNPARAAFLQAYEQSKNPRVLFNVAVMEKNLGRYAAAITWWERELSEGRGQLSAEEEAEIKAAIQGLSKLVMTITIDVSEPGAKVFLGNDEVGTSPLAKPIAVALGSHNIRAIKPGFAEAQAHVDGNEPNPKVSLKLEPLVKTAPVHVAVVGPSSAVVKIDGREVGPAPYSGRVPVSPEPHSFSAEAPGYVPATQSVVVRDDAPLNLTLQLSSEQQKGKLLVVAKPEGATIEIDGKTVGASRWEGPVDTGTHQVVVKKQGFYSWSYDVDVPRGGERSVTAQLNEDRNTSFVPWLIGTVLVVGGSTVALIFIASQPDEEPVRGTLPPFAIGTQGVRF